MKKIVGAICKDGFMMGKNTAQSKCRPVINTTLTSTPIRILQYSSIVSKQFLHFVFIFNTTSTIRAHTSLPHSSNLLEVNIEFPFSVLIAVIAAISIATIERHATNGVINSPKCFSYL